LRTQGFGSLLSVLLAASSAPDAAPENRKIKKTRQE
jgi:hypothetical protein